VDLIFLISVAVGLLLTFSDFIAFRLGVPNDNRDLLVYASIGITLGALGSAGYATWRGVAVTGAAALMLATYWVFGRGYERAIVGTIQISELASGIIIDPTPFLLYRIDSTEWRFAILSSSLEIKNHVTMNVEFGGYPYRFPCISDEAFLRYAGRKPLVLKVIKSTGELRDDRLNTVLST